MGVGEGEKCDGAFLSDKPFLWSAGSMLLGPGVIKAGRSCALYLPIPKVS